MLIPLNNISIRQGRVLFLAREFLLKELPFLPDPGILAPRYFDLPDKEGTK
jgi:hypothetical protein